MRIFIAVIIAVIVFTGFMYVWDWMQDEPEPGRRNPRQDGRERKPRREEGARGRGIPKPETGPKTDSGMNPQERTIPGIIPEPKKPEPVKEERKKPSFKFQRRRASLTPEWKKREQKDRDKGR